MSREESIGTCSVFKAAVGSIGSRKSSSVQSTCQGQRITVKAFGPLVMDAMLEE